MNERTHQRDGDSLPGQPELFEVTISALRSQVRRQWALEASFLRLHQPMPIKVRWTSTKRPVVASRDVVFSESESDWREEPLKGDAEHLINVFRSLPHRQLVMIGEPGAGKTVMAISLTLAILEHPIPGEPAPVLLAISSWNPNTEAIEEFTARRLCEEYGFLGNDDGNGIPHKNLADALLAERRLLLILDGLDELPREHHGLALALLDQFAARGQALIVACRSLEYERAVEISGALLSRAAVIEIDPISIEHAIKFLSHPAPFRSRWEEVFSHLREHPRSPLASILRTPLMISLARSAYSIPNSDPSSLLSTFNRNALTGILIDQFISSVYVDGAPPVRYRQASAGRWLKYIAYNLYRNGICDLQWWQFSLFDTRHIRNVINDSAAWMRVGVVFLGVLLLVNGISFVLEPEVTGSIDVGIFLLGASATGVLRPLWRDTGFPHAHGATRVVKRGYLASLHVGFGVACGLLTGLLADNPLLCTGGFLYGLIMFTMPTWIVPRESRRARGRLPSRISQRAIVTVALQSGVLAGILFAALARIIPGMTSALLAGGIAGLVFAAAAASGSGLCSWINILAGRMWMAARGFLPWRLHSFLEDAHRRGVLRRAGTRWQFRHAIVQEHLARQERVAKLKALGSARRLYYSRAMELVNLLSEMGREDEAIDTMKAIAGQGLFGQEDLAELLAAHGRTDELRALANDGDFHIVIKLTDHLIATGNREEAIAVLQENLTSDSSIAWRLIRLLAEDERIDDLRALATEESSGAAEELAKLLDERGETEEAIEILRQDKDSHGYRSYLLISILAKHERIADLQALAAAGDLNAFFEYTDVLGRQDKTDEAIAALKTLPGDSLVIRRIASLYANQGKADEAIATLRDHTDDPFAAMDLAKILAGLNQVDDAAMALKIHVSNGNLHAVESLAEILTNHGRGNEAVSLLHAFIDRRPKPGRSSDIRYLDYLKKMAEDRSDASSYLTKILAKLKRVDELKAQVSDGQESAVIPLADLLAKEGNLGEAIAALRPYADGGDMRAKYKLVQVLIECGRDVEAMAILEELANAGYANSREKLIELEDKMRLHDD